MSESPERAWRRTAALVAAGLTLALLVVLARLLVDARDALRAGDEAAARGEKAEAIRQYRNAVRLYVPGSSYGRAGLDRLEQIAEVARKAGDSQVARQALEAVRGALLGTRSFYVPFETRLEDADKELARLYAELEDPRVDPGATREVRQAWHAARLARRPGPLLGYAVMALIGFALWLGAAVGFIARGLDSGLRLRRGPAIAAGFLFVVGFALFLTGLRLA